MIAQNDTVFAFDGSFEGFLTIIHGHYYKKWRPADIVLEAAFQQTLGACYHYVETDDLCAQKVYSAVQGKISPEAADRCYAAFHSEDPRALMPLYRYIVLGFSVGAELDNYLHEGDVLAVHKFAGQTLGEAHLLKEFIRFAETETGVYYADVSPAHNALPFLAAHFIDRFMNHPWLIHDVARGRALVYNGRECLLADAPKSARAALSGSEEHYQALWTSFYNSIAVESRVNAKLQRQMLPLHFRKHMTEHRRKGMGRV